MRVPCAGAIVFDPDGRLLLTLRGHAPSAGTWSLPGGRCRPGEVAANACVREVAEETGLQVRVERLVGRVERAGPGDVGYDIADFACTVVGGRLRAGDDAVEARWVARAGFDALPLAPLLAETLHAWGCLPRC
ncbi:MAG: NUDIX hydrolase [Jatrophihabitantaceae bacterium]